MKKKSTEWWSPRSLFITLQLDLPLEEVLQHVPAADLDGLPQRHGVQRTGKQVRQAKGIMLNTLPLAYSSAQHPSSGILYPLATPLDMRCCEPALYT